MRNNPPSTTWLVVCCVAMLALVLRVPTQWVKSGAALGYIERALGR